MPRNSSPARKAAPLGAQDGMGTRATGKKDHQAKCGTESIPHQYQPHRKAVVSQGCKMGRGGAGGVSSRGRRSPTCCCLAVSGVAGPLPALWRGLPVAYHTQRLPAPHRSLSGLGSSGPFQTCSRGSRVLAGTEITMQRAEAARRNRAETAGATPHSGTAASAARH